MRKIFFIATLLVFSMETKAQFFGRKSVGISQGAVFFNASSLNNKNNANNKTSWISEFDRFGHISRFWSFNVGGGVGNYKNPDNRFETYQSTDFYRLKIGLFLHLPSQSDTKPRLVNPFLLVGYNFDLLNKTFKAIGDNRVNVNMKVGGGLNGRISEHVGCFYMFTLNQRLNPDYRTYYQHNIGMLVNLEK